jgi:hypothetical protein
VDAGTFAAISVPDAVAIAAIVAPSAVAIAAIIVGYKQQSRGLEHERKLADLANVRDLIDDAAVHLHRVEYALDAVRRHLGRNQFRFFADAEGQELFLAVERAGEEFDVLRERLAVRLGEDHEAVTRITEANQAVPEIFRALERLKLLPDPKSRLEERQIERLFKRNDAKITAQREAFDGGRREFMHAAQRTAGAQLPTSRSR